MFLGSTSETLKVGRDGLLRLRPVLWEALDGGRVFLKPRQKLQRREGRDRGEASTTIAARASRVSGHAFGQTGKSEFDIVKRRSDVVSMKISSSNTGWWCAHWEICTHTVLTGNVGGNLDLQDWGFFLPYLIGSISLVVLAVGSTAPGLLQAVIDSFSSFFPDYQERIVRHEAAHFLVAYLLGVPILGYSLDIGKEHVNLADENLQKRLYSGQIDEKELDRLAVVSMAGLAAEGLRYDKVVGQSADLISLQRLINRSKPQLSKDQQQNLTRWAVLFAASVLKNNSKMHEALMLAMSQKAPVTECIEAIEKSG